MTMIISSQRNLPDRYSVANMLAYHLRDPEGVSERGTPDTLDKAFVYQGAPSLLRLELSPDTVTASWTLIPPASAIKQENPPGLPPAASLETILANLVDRMLGLQQDIQAFEKSHATHPELGPLITRQQGLRVAATATPFEALAWAIIGQQISVKAAVAIRRRLIQATGPRLPGG